MGSKNPIHPNDHVNLSQSSNDTYPTAMHIAVAQTTLDLTLPALEELLKSLLKNQILFQKLLKLGEHTHKMQLPLHWDKNLVVMHIKLKWE